MIGLTGAIPTPALLSVGIALVLAVVGGAWHIGLRLGRLSEKLDKHGSYGMGELRDRIVRLETVGELRR